MFLESLNTGYWLTRHRYVQVLDGGQARRWKGGRGGKKVVAGAYGGSRALGGCWGRCEG